jgi:hypothetical protein
MATTSYTVAAVAEFAAKPYANLAAAKREADRRAAATALEVEVTTVATGRVSYTATTPAPLPVADQAEVEAVMAAEDRAEALTGVAAAMAALVAKATARIEAAPNGPTPRPAARKAARREGLGDAVVAGWELLYDKPRQAAQVARKDGQYALLCTKHHHVHPVAKLVDERAARKAGGWCPSC